MDLLVLDADGLDTEVVQDRVALLVGGLILLMNPPVQLDRRRWFQGEGSKTTKKGEGVKASIPHVFKSNFKYTAGVDSTSSVFHRSR